MPQQYSVAEVCQIIDKKIKASPELQEVWVRGEITNYQRHASSGHIYITLSDVSQKTTNQRSTLRCTYFKFAQTPLAFELKVGIEVELFGSLGTYAPQSSYNLVVRRVQKVGAGDILLKLQQIRERLLKDGLIKTPQTRRALPLLPKRVGIVTGAGTAALRDMLLQVQERYAHAEIVLAPAMVQGDAAPASIVAALTEIQKIEWQCEVIIVGRGGGSAEDLMAFSDEAVCRAVATCRVPIVSAVGHQIDHPISDDVADMAATTPTAAAQAVFPKIDDFSSTLDNLSKRIASSVDGALRTIQERFLRTSEKDFWDEPYLLVKDQARFLDELESKLHFTFRNRVMTYSNTLNQLAPIEILLAQKLKLTRAAFETTSARFDAYSPLATLARGYSVIYKEDKIITDSAHLKRGDTIRVRLAKGSVAAAVE